MIITVRKSGEKAGFALAMKAKTSEEHEQKRELSMQVNTRARLGNTRGLRRRRTGARICAERRA